MTDEKPPISPRKVLLLAILLPGWGHWRIGQLQRGVIFVFFMFILGWLTFRLSPVERSLIGRYAGGLFVYAISITDAYRLARIRMEEWRHRQLSQRLSSS